MDAFLSHDWAGIVIALVVGLVGFGVFSLGGKRDGKILRWGLPGIGGLVLVVGVVLLGGSLIHVSKIASLSRKYPPPGRLVDVGGGRVMHSMAEGENRITESGRRTPTVIFIGGGYSEGLTLHHLYKALARDTRAIIFDRAGTGWSDWSAEPRTVRNDVEDLVRLLAAAGEEEYDALMAKMVGEQNEQMTSAVVALSSRGRMIHPPDPSTHQFPYEHPEFCAEKVREMTALVTAGDTREITEEDTSNAS
jgi:hypothetical protein